LGVGGNLNTALQRSEKEEGKEGQKPVTSNRVKNTTTIRVKKGNRKGRKVKKKA